MILKKGVLNRSLIKPDIKFRAAVLRIPRPDGSVLLFDYHAGQRQSDSGAFRTDILSSVKALKKTA